MKATTSLLLAAAAAASWGATIELRFPTEVPREVWVLDAEPERMPVGGRAYETKQVPIEAEAAQWIVVFEPESNAVALRKAGEITGDWTLKDEDWKAAEVAVEVFTRGNPMPSGTIRLTAIGFENSQPVENGGAVFFAVPFGDVTVKASYVSGGADKSTEQDFLVRKGAAARLALTVTDPVDTVRPEQEAEKPEQEPSWFGRIAVWLFGLAAGVVALVLVFRLLRERSDVVEDKLRGLGVPIPGDLPSPPEDGEPGPTKPFQQEPVVPEGHCQYCGKPHVECVCRLDAPKPASGHIAGPTLIGAGVELRIPEGESILGREGDLAIQDATVSRRHARIVREGSRIVLTDLGSSNGTYVNGERVEEEVEVPAGAVVHFGSVRVRLEG